MVSLVGLAPDHLSVSQHLSHFLVFNLIVKFLDPVVGIEEEDALCVFLSLALGGLAWVFKTRANYGVESSTGTFADLLALVLLLLFGVAELVGLLLSLAERVEVLLLAQAIVVVLLLPPFLTNALDLLDVAVTNDRLGGAFHFHAAVDEARHVCALGFHGFRLLLSLFIRVCHIY